jgi:hypothetical protein
MNNKAHTLLASEFVGLNQGKAEHKTKAKRVTETGLGFIVLIAATGTCILLGDSLARVSGTFDAVGFGIRTILSSSNCPTPEFSAPSNFGVARGPSRWQALHAAELLDRVGERVQQRMGLEQPGFVDLRFQLNIPEPKVAGHASPGSGTPHICIEWKWGLADGEWILAHELSHLWRGPHKALPVLEEGKADLVALRTFPLQAHRMLRVRKSSLRKLIESPAGRIRGGRLLLEAALAPSWDYALELLGVEGDHARGDLYALGLEMALRMESGRAPTSMPQLNLDESLLISLAPPNGPFR